MVAAVAVKKAARGGLGTRLLSIHAKIKDVC